MTRDEIDRELRAFLASAGLQQYQVAWNARPARLSVLVGDEEKSVPISTRAMTKRRLREVGAIIASWGRMQKSHRDLVKVRGRG